MALRKSSTSEPFGVPPIQRATERDARDPGDLLQPPLPCKSLRPPDGADRRTSRAHTSQAHFRCITPARAPCLSAFFLHRAHARIWQALAFLSASAMVARVVALLALALLAVTDAVPRRVKQVRTFRYFQPFGVPPIERAEDARDAGYLLQPPLPCKCLRPPGGADRRASRAHTSKCAPGHARWHVVAADARRRQRAGNVDAKGVGCIWCDAYAPD